MWTGCSQPESVEIQGVIDSVNQALSFENCSQALYQIEPFYHSSRSNNAIRLTTASAYGCAAGVNFFRFVSDLTHYGGNLSGTGFWEFLVQEYPSTVSDRKAEAAEDGIFALLAAIKPGIVTDEDVLITRDPHNAASLSVSDRDDNANAYLLILSMAAMGSLLSREGAPSANGHKSHGVNWTSPTATSGAGCEFASSLLHFSDSLGFILVTAAQDLSPELLSSYSQIQTLIGSAMGLACRAGCLACGGSVSCSGCPLSLRDPKSCAGQATDVNSCAAAGIAAFINASWQGPP